MAETKDYGRFFYHWVSIDPIAPRYHVYPSYELDWPYRASRSVILRLWGRKAIVLGWWEDNPDPAEDVVIHYMRALNAKTEWNLTEPPSKVENYTSEILGWQILSDEQE